MSIDQSRQPQRKTLISKLSSRSRRRRRENREEKVPIPSFSFTPPQQQENESVADEGATSDRQQTKVMGGSSVQGQLEGSGKENAQDIAQISDNNTRTDGSSDKHIISRKVTDHSEQQTNVAPGIQSASANAPKAKSPASLGINSKITSSNSNNAVEKGSADVKECSSSTNISSTTTKTADNSINCSNSSYRCSSTKAAKKLVVKDTDSISGICQTSTTSKKRKIDLDEDINADVSLIKQNHDGSKTANDTFQKYDAPSCKSSIVDDQNSKQPCIATSLEETTAPPAKASNAKPRRKSAEKNSCGLKQMKTKKETTKNKRKKSAPNEVIQIDSDSESSSCNLTIRSSTKKATAKKRVKVEKKVKLENKDSTKPLKQKYTGNQFKSSSSRGKKLCYACSTCKCNSRDGTSATPTKDVTVTLSGSHARQERALINRLQKIERNVQWMGSQKYDVSRQLMKHRKLMTKKWEEGNPLNSEGRPKFLVDILLDDNGCDESKKLSSEEVVQANFLIFGETQAKTVRKTTLTQIFGTTDKSDVSPIKPVCSDNEEDSNLSIQSECEQEVLSPKEPVVEDGSQKTKANAHLTAMVDFVETLAYNKEDGHLSMWKASATAPEIASKFDEIMMSPCSISATGMDGVTSPASRSNSGLDELLQLFARTPSKSSGLHDSIQHDIDGAVDEEMNVCSLTPRGRQIVEDIEKSVSDKPTQLAAIERTCPRWRESVKFSQTQTDPQQLANALETVTKAKSHVLRMKERIIQALTDREQTLEIFAESLERSMARLND